MAKATGTEAAKDGNANASEKQSAASGTPNGTNGDTSPATRRKEALPEGFDQKLSRDMGDGWLVKETDTRVVGKLRGRHAFKGDDGLRIFYQIELCSLGNFSSEHKNAAGEIVAGVKANFKPQGEEESKEVILQNGALLNVDEHKVLEEMGPLSRDGGGYIVMFKYTTKRKIPGTKNSLWQVEGPYVKTVRAPSKAPGPDPYAVGGGGRVRGTDTDDIPF